MWFALELTSGTGIPGFVDKAAVGAVRRTPNIEHMEQVRASEVPPNSEFRR